MGIHLTVRRPSTTTVSFTVSNASPRSTLPAKLAFYLQVLVRALLFVCVLLIDTAKLRHMFFLQNGPIVPWEDFWLSRIGSLACRAADAYSWRAVVAASALIIYGVFRKGYTGQLNWPNPKNLKFLNSILTPFPGYRRIAARYPWARNPDVYLFCLVLFHRCDEIHSNNADPRYCYT